MPSQPCGCDPEAQWLCAWHKAMMEQSADEVNNLLHEMYSKKDDSLYAAEARVRQSRDQSLKEAITNLVVGFSLSAILQVTLYPIMGVELSHGQNTIAVSAFTALTLIRSYIIRRIFNRF